MGAMKRGIRSDVRRAARIVIDKYYSYAVYGGMGGGEPSVSDESL